MTTKAKTAQALIFPLLAQIQAKIMERYAEQTQPTTVLPPAYSSRQGAVAELWMEMLRAYVHEHGHRAAMLHLAPSSDPSIELDISLKLTNSGIGAEIQGARCGTYYNFAEDGAHSEVVVSVAGWLAETVAVSGALKGDDLPPLPFNSMSGSVIASLWTGGERFTQAFPGCSEDAALVHKAARKWLPDEALAADFNPETDPSAKEMVRTVARKLESACDAALRIVQAQAGNIIADALRDAEQHFRITLESSAIVSDQVDRMTAAAAGLFTPEAIAARKAEIASGKGAQDRQHTWTHEKGEQA